MAKGKTTPAILESLVERLTRYGTIAQSSMCHVAHQCDRDQAKLQPFYDQAIALWSNNPLRILPFPDAPETQI